MLCYVMAALEPYRFEPERSGNVEDDESGNDEINGRLEGTFWCTCEICEVMPSPRECVCCREQPESENKMEGTLRPSNSHIHRRKNLFSLVNCFKN